MVSMRGEAQKSYEGKLDRMGLRTQTATTGPTPEGHQRSTEDGTDGMARGGRAKGYATAAENEQTLNDKAPKRLRLDRKPYANGGSVKKKNGTTVNVIVAPQGAGGPAAAPPMPPAPPMMPPKPPAAPPMPPPGGGPGVPGAGAPPPMPMMRNKGGRVPHIISDGAGGGKGRLQKIKAYGDRAKPGGKAGTM